MENFELRLYSAFSHTYVLSGEPCPLSTIHEARVLAYADDTKLLMIIHGLLDSATLQVDLNKVSEWSNFCELSLNPSKCSHVNYHFNKTLSCHEYLSIMTRYPPRIKSRIWELSSPLTCNGILTINLSYLRLIRCFTFYVALLLIHL